MIIDIGSKAKQKSQEQENQQQQEIVARLKNILRLAEEGFIVSFISCGFTSEGRMFISNEYGQANPHEINSAIAVMQSVSSQFVIKTEAELLKELSSNIGVFSLPQQSKETS